MSTLTLLFEERPVEARPTDTIAAALLRDGVEIFSRGPKYHRPRGPFCLAGTCGQCQMRVNGEPNVATCLTHVSDGMQIERQNVLGSADHDLLRAVDFLFPEGLDHHHLMTGHKVLTAATQAITRRLAGIGQAPSAPIAVRPAIQRTERLVVIGGGKAGRAAAEASGIHPLVLDAHDNARALGLYQEGGKRWIVALTSEGLLQIAVEAVIVATGSIERPIPFESNDLPGIFAGRALLRLIREHGVVPGKKAVVIARHSDAPQVAEGLRAHGLQVQIVEDEITRATGRHRVTGLRVGEKQLRCDLVAVVAPRAPAYELAAQIGVTATLRSEAGGFVLDSDENGATNVPWVWVAGSVAGRSGTLAGRAAAAFLTSSDTRR